jgi:hypothetical protein
MDTLDTLLKTAAEADWAHVVRRCAWCGRVADRHGRYVRAVIVEPETVFTDGMCPPCGSRALASLARRPRRPAVAVVAA